MYIINVFSQS